MITCLEEDLEDQATVIYRLINDLRAVINAPLNSDIIRLIIVNEKMERFSKTLESRLPHGAARIMDHHDRMRNFKVLAETMVSNFLPQEEQRLIKEAKSANSEQTFHAIIEEIKNLNDGVGKIAHDNEWIGWNERPWHVYDLVRSLKIKWYE